MVIVQLRRWYYFGRIVRIFGENQNNTAIPNRDYMGLQGNPCNKNRDPAMRTGVPCYENRVFPVRIDSQGVPCEPYGVWVCSAENYVYKKMKR